MADGRQAWFVLRYPDKTSPVFISQNVPAFPCLELPFLFTFTLVLGPILIFPLILVSFRAKIMRFDYNWLKLTDWTFWCTWGCFGAGTF